MRNQRGITLIALVITIIVLLILAGVSIAMLTGDNGVLKKASESSAKTNIAVDKEAAITDLNAAYTAYMEAKYATTGTISQDFDAWMKENGESYMKRSSHYSYTMASGTVTTSSVNADGKTETATINQKGGFGTWTANN